MPPEIRINYLATETDRTAFIEGFKILRKILAAPALKPYAVDEIDPGSKVTSDEDILAFCRKTGSTVYHPTSTCRMGNDPLAVVDQRLRLRGIEGLRVVDASVMPDLMSGNTNAPTIMIAEKASDMILEDASVAHLHSGIGWLYLPAGISQDAARRRMEREWWQFECGSARARAPWRWPRPRKLPGA